MKVDDIWIQDDDDYDDDFYDDNDDDKLNMKKNYIIKLLYCVI
jgi:hypothetical protein